MEDLHGSLTNLSEYCGSGENEGDGMHIKNIDI